MSKMSLELSLLLTISRGGDNPFGNPTSSKNSRYGMEFKEGRVGSNKLGQRRLSKKCFTSKHHTLPPYVILGVILYSKTWIFVQL
jgi:hypothetical protein